MSEDELIEDFEDKKRQTLIGLVVKAEKAACTFPAIDFVDVSLILRISQGGSTDRD